jgi:carboxymethylenebutenolidase
MAERIVSMHAAHRSGKEVVDGFLSRPTGSGERTAIVLVHGAGVIYYQSLFPDPKYLKSISAPMLCHYGTDDRGTTRTEIDLFRASLDRYEKKYQIEMYPGAGHAFLNNPSSKHAANRDAAVKSVAITSKWLRKALA